ncbi:MAG: glycosyltransferase family 4 protein [Chloroflexi bacterium]|nr:glycosyltransferase family 4 protein [Chloroflexota bacterium]
MPPSIAVNGRFLTRRITGVDRYAFEISSRLDSARRLTPSRPRGLLAGHAWEQLILPARLRRGEILFSPANAGPWTVRAQAVTLHDASVFDHPEWFRPAFALWTRLAWKILVKQVRMILTVSEFSRERLQFHLNIPAEKIRVIPNGVGKPFGPQSTRAIDAMKGKYNLTKPYFLFVGTLEPRKNLGRLIEAWERSDGHFELVIVGTEGTVFASGNRRPAPNDKHPTYIGRVPDVDLPALYSAATALVIPSLYEGFGLPALEALACGAAVIASNTSAFPEVLGDAALFVDPLDTNGIAEAMQTIAKDSALANELRARGLQRAAQFSWDDSARRIEAILKNI